MTEDQIRHLIQSAIEAERGRIAKILRSVDTARESVLNADGYPVDGPQDAQEMFQAMACEIEEHDTCRHCKCCIGCADANRTPTWYTACRLGRTEHEPMLRFAVDR